MSSFNQATAPAVVSNISASHLLTQSRLRTIALCWIGIAPVVYVVDLLGQTRDGLSDGVSRAFGDDFVNYWSGPFLVLHGRIAEVYDLFAFHAFEQSITGSQIGFYHYGYAPFSLILLAPLALLPYVPALFVWLTATWYGFYRALKLTGDDNVLLLSLAVPALFINAAGGQNGALTAALLGGGLLQLDRRPVAAGILFALLAYKPHLALMLPIALMAGKRWQTIFAAMATATLLVGASIIAFGIERWFEYARTVSFIRTLVLDDGTGVWHRMLSVFVFARRLGFGVESAYVLQFGTLILAAFFVARSWARNDPACIRNLLVVLGIFISTPYLQDYDFVVGAFVVVWLQTAEVETHLRTPWTRVVMAGILLAPLVAAPFGKATGFSLGPIVTVPAFLFVVWMASRRRQDVLSPKEGVSS